MRHNDLGSQKVRVLNVVDHLGSCLNAELTRININGGKLGRGEPGKEGIVKGNDGKILWNG